MQNVNIFFMRSVFLIYLLPECVPFERNLKAVYEAFNNNDRTPKCRVPNIDGRKIEILCFNVKELISGPLIFRFEEGYGVTSSKNYQLQEDQCILQAAVIIIRCRIGYINVKSENDNYLNICMNGEWEYENNDNNDCKLICGQKFDPINEKTVVKPLIYNAKLAEIGSSPWHVAIFKNYSSDKIDQICGGSIVHSNIVISAGHCFEDGRNTDVSKYLIGAGKHNRNYNTYEEPEQFANIKEIKLPPTFQSFPLRSDIVVVILKQHLKFTNFVSPVCLDWDIYKPGPIRRGYLTHLFGWGATTAARIASQNLLTTELETITNDECKARIERNAKAEVTDERFCAVNLNNSTACEGDSGGGLILQRRYYNLIGIVSVGVNEKNYCSDGFLALFTNVQYFHNFIKAAISENRNKEYGIDGLA